MSPEFNRECEISFHNNEAATQIPSTVKVSTKRNISGDQEGRRLGLEPSAVRVSRTPSLIINIERAS